jgi:hypothetical protein
MVIGALLRVGLHGPIDQVRATRRQGIYNVSLDLEPSLMRMYICGDEFVITSALEV